LLPPKIFDEQNQFLPFHPYQNPSFPVVGPTKKNRKKYL